MPARQKLIAPFGLFLFALFAASANADTLVYVLGAIGISNQGQFGTIDVNTGAFQQIGPDTPYGSFGLAPRPDGSFATLAYSGNLYSINPATGSTALIGPTGLGDCTTVGVSPCPPNSAFDLAALAGKIYATDFQNSLYTVNPVTGAATLLAAHTGIPPSPFVLGSLNADGTINFADEAIWGAGGKLFATFDAFTFNLTSNMIASVVVAPELYQINPATGLATIIGPTALGIGAVVDVNGTEYAFDDLSDQVLSLNLANGSTSFVSNFDPAAGVIQGAAAVPEPRSAVLAVTGIAAVLIWRRRRYRIA